VRFTGLAWADCCSPVWRWPRPRRPGALRPARPSNEFWWGSRAGARSRSPRRHLDAENAATVPAPPGRAQGPLRCRSPRFATAVRERIVPWRWRAPDTDDPARPPVDPVFEDGRSWYSTRAAAAVPVAALSSRLPFPGLLALWRTDGSGAFHRSRQAPGLISVPVISTVAREVPVTPPTPFQGPPTSI